jgi:hypothetical protein
VVVAVAVDPRFMELAALLDKAAQASSLFTIKIEGNLNG